VDILSLAVGFSVGMLLSLTLASGLLYYFSKKALKDLKHALLKKQDELKEQTKQAAAERTLGGKSVSEDVYKKMQQVQNITKLQNDLMYDVTKPNARSKIEELEHQKLDLLTDILADGYDPVIAAVDPSTGERTEYKLSEFLNIDPNYITKQPEPAKGVKIEKKGKFFVIQEDEKEFDEKVSNDDDDSGDTTFH
jgi:hypothetical protein